MDHQETLNGSNRRGSAGKALAEHMADMTRDVARITQLQAELFGRDARLVWPALMRSARFGVAGILLLATMLPVALAGAGLWLAEMTDLSAAGGLLCIAAAAGLVAIVLLALARRQVIDQRRRFERSANELKQNWNAVISAFANCGRTDSAD